MTAVRQKHQNEQGPETGSPGRVGNQDQRGPPWRLGGHYKEEGEAGGKEKMNGGRVEAGPMDTGHGGAHLRRWRKLQQSHTNTITRIKKLTKITYGSFPPLVREARTRGGDGVSSSRRLH
jgi:hypothetical protein